MPIDGPIRFSGNLPSKGVAQHITQQPVGNVQQAATSQPEPLSADVHALCVLLARILLRCLRERDERVMRRLDLPFSAVE